TWQSSDAVHSLLAGCASGEAPVNEWNHLAFGYSARDKRGRFWLNGSEEQFDFTGPLTVGPPTTGTSPFLIGASNGTGSIASFFEGLMRDIRFYPRLLKTDEAQLLASNRYARVGDGQFGLLRSAEDDDGLGTWAPTGDRGAVSEIPKHFPMG